MRNDFFNYLIKDKVMYLVDTNYKQSNKSLETLITIKEDVLEDKDLTLEKNIMKYTIVKNLAINGVSDFKDLDFLDRTEVIEKIYQLGPAPLIELIKNTDSNEWGDNFDLLYGI